MNTAYKYDFFVTDKFVLDLPLLFEILHVGVQDGTPCIWAKVNPDHDTSPVTFYVTGTGRPIPIGAIHIATFQMPPFVRHLWRKP